MNKASVKKSKVQGRGIFARHVIRKGRLVEIAPVLVFDKKDAAILEKTALGGYHYEWGKKTFALAMGLGSLFNHSYNPNAVYEMDYRNKTIKFYALRDIKKNEEIFVNYNGDPDSQKPLWFKA